jgi:hypothetical protein
VLSAAPTTEVGLEDVTEIARREARAAAAHLLEGPNPVVPDELPTPVADAVHTVVRTASAAVVEQGPALVVPVAEEGVLVLVWDPDQHDGLHDLDPSVPAQFAEQVAVGATSTTSSSSGCSRSD